MSAESAFPILYGDDVEALAEFYERGLGCEPAFRWPTDGPVEYVYLRLGPLGIGITSRAAAQRLHGLVTERAGPSFELCVYVRSTDEAVDRLVELGGQLLAEPRDMPWGERLAYVQDPAGNPVHLTMRIG